jgi:hypothetical protein
LKNEILLREKTQSTDWFGTKIRIENKIIKIAASAAADERAGNTGL